MTEQPTPAVCIEARAKLDEDLARIDRECDDAWIKIFLAALICIAGLLGMLVYEWYNHSQY